MSSVGTGTRGIATPSLRDGVRSGAGWLGAILLGLVLLVAVAAKSLDPLAFAEQIASEGLGFGAPFAMAVFALALEAGLGVALLLGVRRPIVLVPATLMVLFFLFLTGRAWYLDARGLLPEGTLCGCFGNLVDRTPKQAFWSDLVMLVPALGLAWVGRERQPGSPRVRLALAAVAAIGVGIFAAKAPSLPLDDLATRLAPGVVIADICAGKETRVCLPEIVHSDDLNVGEHWIILTDLPALEGRVDPLNERVWSGTSSVPFHVFTSAPDAEAHAFGFTFGPAFDVHADMPVALLRPLYRTLPRSFRVIDGTVVETVSGWPPWLDAVAPSTSSGDPT